MRSRLLAIALLLASIAAGRAQNITLKTGQVVETTGVRRSGDNVMGKIVVGATTGEVGYPISNIAKIDFPEPLSLSTARELLLRGESEKALKEIEPVVKYYEPFKTLPGSWWAQAALVKVSALAALKRDKEAEPLAVEIRSSVSDPDLARAADLRLAEGLIRDDQYDKAAKICDTAIQESTDPSVLADAWVIKGDLLAAQRQWDSALLAYLHVPVFYHDERLFMPSALLGSARAFHRMEDNPRARRTLEELISTFPKSAEASIAQKEVEKLPK